jgi:outer membrane protein assembly factor BamA
MTTKDIEAAMQRLADTGLFANTRYAVDSRALTLTLTPIDAKQTLPLRYANLVWWKSDELTPLVHARVPLFQGTVPLNGGLLDSVKQALTALLAQKSITASLDSMSSTDVPGGPVTAITLSISSPEIKIGEVHFDGASPSAAPELAKVREKISGDDFDEASTPKAIVNDTEDVYRDDGYLDIVVDPPSHAAPRADGPTRFLVDLSTNVHGGELYHVSSAEVRPAPPISAGDLKKLLQIKAGDPASLFELRTAQNRLVSPYHHAGYLEADAHLDTAKDSTAHKIGYTFTMVPGELYHVVSVQSSGFTPQQQAEFEHSFHVASNAVFDDAVFMQVASLNRSRAFDGTRIQLSSMQDRKQHTVALTLKTVHAPTH